MSISIKRSELKRQQCSLSTGMITKILAFRFLIRTHIKKLQNVKQGRVGKGHFMFVRLEPGEVFPGCWNKSGRGNVLPD